MLKNMLFAVLISAAFFSKYSQATNLKFTQEEQDWIAAHSEVSIAFIDNLPPALISEQNGAYSGFVADYAKLLSAETGINFQLHSEHNWEQLLASAQNGDVDVLGLVAPRVSYSTRFDYTLTKVRNRTHIFGPRHSSIPGLELSGLKNQRVGYQKDFRYLCDFIETYPDIDFVPMESSHELVTALDNDAIDFVIHSEWFGYALRTQGISKYKSHLELPELETSGVMAVRNDWPQLTRIINKVLTANSSAVRDIQNQWLNAGKNAGTNPPSVELTPEEKNWLIEHPEIRFGFDPNWAPVEYIDAGGHPQGIAFEYLRIVKERLGIKLTHVPHELWTDAYQAATQSELDLLPVIVSTEERRKHLKFTGPYLSMTAAIFSADDRAYIGGIGALRGKSVIVVEGYALQSWLAEHHPQLEIQTAPSIEAALREVASGRVYAFIGNLISTSYYIGQSGQHQIKVVSEIDFKYDLAMAVRKDWEPLIPILQKALNTISPSEENALYNKWISIQYNHSVDYTTLFQWLSLAGFALLAILYWNHRLKKEVNFRRSAELALIESKHQTEEASQKVQEAVKAKSEFLANMSHEIRTPMNTVICAGHLLHQTKLSPKQHEYLNILSHSAEVLLETVDGVLDFSKGEANMLELEDIRFHIDDVLFRVKQIFRLSATAKDIELTIQVDPQIPETLRGDSEKLGQILRNLVSNAIKFTDTGSVNVSVSLDKLDSVAQIAILQFEVRDAGKGISSDVQSLLFQPYVQGLPSVSRTHGGSGLGLAISQQLADLMGGQIWVKSEAGKGSLFTVELPFKVENSSLQNSHRANLRAPENPAPIEPIPELIDVRVLLVEDNELNLFLGKSFLELFGITVTTAINGEEALQKLEADRFDLVLMDIMMPGMDGYETSREIRKNPQWDLMPIVALTAHASEEDMEKSREVGMNDYLTKPFKAEQLRDTLLKWAPPTAAKQSSG